MGLRSLGCALVLCLLVAGTASAGPKETHKLGVEAIDAGRWAEAERFFRAAIAERPEERVNRLLKTAYVPHYYLGVALAEAGDCKAAVASWAESNRQAQIEKSDLAADLQRRKSSCQDLLRRIDTARSEVDQLLANVDEAAASLVSLSRTPDLAPSWNQGSPSFSSRQKGAEKKLADARGRFDARTIGEELEQLEQAKSLASSALTELNAALTDARRRLGELNAATAAALEQLEEIEQRARRFLRSISDLAPYPRRLGLRAAAVERHLATVRESKSGSSPQQLATLGDDLNGALNALRRAARRPPGELTRAVEAFLQGSYTEALALLEVPALIDDERTRPHVCLIRAASQHALWVLGGEQDESLRDLAAEAITACNGSEPETEPSEPETEPSILPNERFFSPRFVEFHAATLVAQSDQLEATASLGIEGDLAGGEGDASSEAGEGDADPTETDPAAAGNGQIPEGQNADADTGSDPL